MSNGMEMREKKKKGLIGKVLAPILLSNSKSNFIFACYYQENPKKQTTLNL
jgi:hypothetical protein